MRLWSSFLEPMLGVSPRPHNSDDSEGDVSKHQASQSTAEGESDDRSPSANYKQSKAVLNENGNTSAMRGTTCRTTFRNAETLLKGDEHTVTSAEQSNTSSRAVTTGVDISRGRVNIENSGHGMNSSTPNKSATGVANTIKSNVDGPLSKVEASSSVEPSNGQSAEGCGVNGYKDITMNAAKNEKEEGELSPNGDSVEDICVAYRDNLLKYFQAQVIIKKASRIKVEMG